MFSWTSKCFKLLFLLVSAKAINVKILKLWAQTFKKQIIFFLKKELSVSCHKRILPFDLFTYT